MLNLYNGVKSILIRAIAALSGYILEREGRCDRKWERKIHLSLELHKKVIFHLHKKILYYHKKLLSCYGRIPTKCIERKQGQSSSANLGVNYFTGENDGYIYKLVFPSTTVMNPNALINDINLASSILPDTTNDQLITTEENSNHGSLQMNNNVIHSSVPLSSQIVSSNSSHPSSSLPASENWPGQYDFTVSFNVQSKDTKGVTWTYSEIKDKLYVGKDVPCPINFSVNTVMPPGNVTIRAMALYSSPEQVSEIVHRCVNHSMKEINNGRPEAEHLVRCETSTATYHTDASSGRHSVSVPFENPAVGQQYSTYIYKFACFGSCSGGPNRRPLMLIFTLECGNQVIGRRKLDVKICACPGRDRKIDEAQCLATDAAPRSTSVKRKGPSELVNLSEVMEFSKNVYLPPPKKSKATPNEDGVYIIEIEDKECYDFLRHMKKFYDICKFMKSFPPDFIARAKHLSSKNNQKSEG